jgi:hypothetical protein
MGHQRPAINDDVDGSSDAMVGLTTLGAAAP